MNGRSREKNTKRRECYEEIELERKGFKQIKTDTQKTEIQRRRRQIHRETDREGGIFNEVYRP